MQLHTVLFDVPRRKGFYRRMAKVLAFTAELHSPSTPLIVHEVNSGDEDIHATGKFRKACYIDNGRKTKHHCDIVQEAPDGELIGLLDADMMVLGDLSEVEQLDFDLAYTVRPDGSRYAFNSGTVFVRTSERMRDFYKLWYEKALQFLSCEKLHAEWRPLYGGINQCALAWMLDNHAEGLKTQKLPCEIWNCENESWQYFSEETKVVHLVGDLRRRLMRLERSKTATIEQLAKMWSGYDRTAKEMARSIRQDSRR